MPTLLWTDSLVFILVFMLTMFIFHVRRHEHLRRPWRKVLHSKVAMGSAVVLCIYLVIGLLDSFHYHPRVESPDGSPQTDVIHSTQIKSVLDYLVGHLNELDEKTYSAPFAAYQYSKETVELPGGQIIRSYPRLLHGGSHLGDPRIEKIPDIVMRIVIASLKATVVILLVIFLLNLKLSRAQKQSPRDSFFALIKGQNNVPWRTIIVTFSICLWLVFIAWDLSYVYHIFGTDKVGQDVFYQALKSIRTGLVIGTLTTLIMLPFAVFFGIAAGYFRGWVDDVIQYIYTTLNSIPGVLLIAASILMLQVYMANNADAFTSIAARSDTRLLFLCLILGVTSWTGLCRMLRGETMKLREVDFIQASQAFGVGHFTIIVRHILPNVMHLVLISVVLDFSGLVLAEAVLSYINIGVDPSMNSWGNMINAARLEMARDPIVWWSLAAAFLFMFVLVLAANLFSDQVRDAFDPRLHERND